MKVCKKRSIFSTYLVVRVDGKIEKIGLKIKNIQGWENVRGISETARLILQVHDFVML